MHSVALLNLRSVLYRTLCAYQHQFPASILGREKVCENSFNRQKKDSRPANLELFSSPLFACLLALYPIGECVGW